MYRRYFGDKIIDFMSFTFTCTFSNARHAVASYLRYLTPHRYIDDFSDFFFFFFLISPSNDFRLELSC